MGEGTRDPSGKRQKSAHDVDVKSSSDSELAHGKGRNRGAKAKEQWPFLECLTVDELVRYRRRRIQGHSKDNLGPCEEPEAVYKDLSTEYRRAFRAGADDLKEKTDLTKNEETRIHPLTEDLDQIAEDEETKQKEEVAIIPSDDTKKLEAGRQDSNFVALSNVDDRPPPISSSKSNGDFNADTEMYSAYVAYVGNHRPSLARRPTSLRMEGEMDVVPEKSEKFVQWFKVSRPELMRVPTHLKLEGDLETSTENHDNYVPFIGVKRPEIVRQGDNLKLEGESRFIPEYTDVFKHPVLRELQTNHKHGRSHASDNGKFIQSAPTSESRVNPAGENMRAIEKEKQGQTVLEEQRKKQDEMKLLISKLEELKNSPLETPEYKDAYKDFPRERPKFTKPQDEIGRSDGSKLTWSSPRPKFTKKIDQDPEYKSMYLNYTEDRPVYQKPPTNPRSSQSSSRRSSGMFSRSLHKNSKHLDYQNMDGTSRLSAHSTSETRSQHILRERLPKVESSTISMSSCLEDGLSPQIGSIDAYSLKKDSHPFAERQGNRRRDHSTSAFERKENYWLLNDNSEQFGQVNAAQDQDAFQVLHTRIHEDNVVDRPHTSSRRHSQMHITRPTHLEIAECSPVHIRSPSQMYRLHVCNVDDEPRKFGQQRRSPPLQSSARAVRNPSPIRLSDVDNESSRPYSPSFGKQRRASRQSFVVLDGASSVPTPTASYVRGRRMSENRNIENFPLGPMGRPRTPNNWMPPWYDNNTNTL